MKIKLKVTLPDSSTREVTTNLFCIAEWERQENRKVSDGRGIGVTDLVAWAFILLKMSEPSVIGTAKTWTEWLQANPTLEIEALDTTDPNPTGAAPTAAN